MGSSGKYLTSRTDPLPHGPPINVGYNGPMNTDYVVRNLHEAAEGLQKAIEAAEADEFGSLMVYVAFTYRKLNLAWNSRDLSNAELLSQRVRDEHELRCRFPTDISDQISD
jgi:hypothetical protein